jgi:LPXTG-motif cell wall-anchored protein
MKIYVENSEGDLTEITSNPETATIALVKEGEPGQEVDTNDIQVTFASPYALTNAGKDVKITFDSVLNTDAETGRTSNDITSTLTFTNDLDGHTTQKNDSVHEYSFSLDSEILKVEKDVNSGALKPFANAVFTLTKVNPSNDASHVAPTTTTYTTGANGKVVFTHLDEGTYKVQETSAPSGYAVNSTEYTVTITPTYTGVGSASALQKYAITVAYTDASGDPQSNTYEYDGDLTAGSEAKIVVNNNVVDETETTATKVINIKLAQLPATGRNGTVLFSIIGAAIMAAAVIIILKKRDELVE